MWLANKIADLFKIVFEVLGIRIDFQNFVGTIKNLCSWNVIQNTDIWKLASQLHQVIIPIGLSLLTLFFLIDLTKKVMEFDRLSWERIVFTCIRFFLFKMLIENSFELLSAIMGITNDVLSKVTVAISSNSSLPDLATLMRDLVAEAGGIVDRTIMAVIVLILYIPFIGTLVGILVQVFLRVGKLILAFAFAPIPIAIGTWEDGQNVAKRFIMSTASLGFEASMIVVATTIYASALSSLAGSGGAISTMIGVMFLNGFLMALISMIGGLAEKWTGGN